MKTVKYEVYRDARGDIYYNIKDNCCHLHFHSKIEILYILSGKKKVTINDNTRILSEDNIALSLGYDAHQYADSADSKQIVLNLPVNLFFDYYEKYGKYSLCNNFLSDKNLAQMLKPLFYRIIESKDDLYIASGYCTALLGSLVKHLGLKEMPEQEKLPLIKEILFYIEENYKDSPTLGQLADKFGFSRNYMSHLFNTKVGTGFSDYMNFVKIRHAADEINSGNKNITEVCYKHGFGSLASFYRCFKQHYGTTPKGAQKKSKKTIKKVASS